MATASDRMGGAGLGGLAKASELKSRLLFTVGALIIYRLGTYLPIPGIDPGALSDIFSSRSFGSLTIFSAVLSPCRGIPGILSVASPRIAFQ